MAKRQDTSVVKPLAIAVRVKCEFCRAFLSRESLGRHYKSSRCRYIRAVQSLNKDGFLYATDCRSFEPYSVEYRVGPPHKHVLGWEDIKCEYVEAGAWLLDRRGYSHSLVSKYMRDRKSACAVVLEELLDEEVYLKEDIESVVYIWLDKNRSK